MTDITVTITNQDALDAINAIIAANGANQTLAQFLSDYCSQQFSGMRYNQLLNAALAKVLQDPAIVAFQVAHNAAVK